MYVGIVALILMQSSWGSFEVSATSSMWNTVTESQIDITATASGWVGPQMLCVRCRDLYETMRPRCNVRLAAVCRARSETYWDCWDGDYNPVTHYRRGVRIYYNKIDCRTLTNGKFYIIDGYCPQMGRIYATAIRPVNP